MKTKIKTKLKKFLLLLFFITVVALGTIKMFEQVERGSIWLKFEMVDLFDGELPVYCIASGVWEIAR